MPSAIVSFVDSAYQRDDRLTDPIGGMRTDDHNAEQLAVRRLMDGLDPARRGAGHHGACNRDPGAASHGDVLVTVLLPRRPPR